MITETTPEKKKLTFLFAGFYLSSALLLILIFTVFWSSADGSTDPKNARLSGDEQIEQVDDFLQSHLNGLQYLDRKFASLVVDSGMKANYDSTFSKIQLSQLAFKNAMDSIDGKFVGSRNMAKVGQIISSYKSVLESRKAINDMQSGITTGSKQIGNEIQVLTQMKNDLQKKDSTIAALMEQLKADGHGDRYSVNFPSTDYQLLKNENKLLKSELKLVEAKFNNQRNTRARLEEENKTYYNMLLNDPNKSSANPKIQRVKTTSYEEGKQP